VPVWSIAPESVIVSPAPDQALRAGETIEIWGWAWADRGVSAVDVSVDGAPAAMRATVEPFAERAWQRFAVDWRPDERRDVCELRSRAQSAAGHVQPESGARNAVHRVAVRVV
jgi:Bacterial Ig domain